MQDGELYIEAQYEAKEIKINGSNHWKILHHWPKSINSSMDRGHEVLFVATGDCLPSHPTKDGSHSTITISICHIDES